MTEKPFDIVVVGELNPDLILSGNVEPAFGQVEKLVDNFTLTMGSSSGIFACGAARLGLRVAFIGKVGKDQFGRYIKEDLENHGVDTSGVIMDEHSHTGISVILARGNDRAILTYPGAIPELRFDEIKPEWVTRARHLHLAAYFILDALRPDAARLFDLAWHSGMTTSLDTNYDPSGKWDGGLQETLQRTDIFLPNETEGCAIAGEKDTARALQKLSTQVKTVVMKLGADGVMMHYGGQVYREKSLPVKVVDTVGAGDSFDAGFLYGFLKGWEPQRTLKLAAVCGSLSTLKAGGTTAQATLEEALAHMTETAAK
jgi:sugar/nucleoside kinase (ribokinase family)